MTIIEEHTSPLSWPFCLCSAPASSPGARPPPRPCGGQRSKGQRRWKWKGTRRRTGKPGQPTAAVLPVEWPGARGRAMTPHPPGTLLEDCAANLDGIPPTQVCDGCGYGCCTAMRAGWLQAGWNTTCPVMCFLCLRFLRDLWKCKDRQQTDTHQRPSVFSGSIYSPGMNTLSHMYFLIETLFSWCLPWRILCNLLLLLGIQVPDQGVPFVDQYDQFIQ